jgi:hypothetical protein
MSKAMQQRSPFPFDFDFTHGQHTLPVRNIRITPHKMHDEIETGAMGHEIY